MRWLLLLVNWVVLTAAEPDLIAGSSASQAAAEQQLEAARLRINREQAALLAELQAGIAAGNSLRERVTAAEHATASAAAELATALREHDRGQAQLQQLVERTAAAAKLGNAAPTALPARMEAALVALDHRLAALPQRLGLHLEDQAVADRHGRIITVPVLRLGEARRVALGTDASGRGFLVPTADGGSWLVSGPTPPSVVLPTAGRVAYIAFDATGSTAQHSGDGRRSFTAWLAAGRFFIWPIILVLLVGIGIMIERAIAFSRRQVKPARLAEIARQVMENPPSAHAAVAAGATPLDRVLRAGLGCLGRPREVREAAVEQVLLAETAHLSRGLSALAVLAGVAPLLGLLGTVTGMIDLFGVLAAQGTNNPHSLSGGISEALICTQAGMLVAIPLLLAHAWLSRLADRRAQLLEEAACAMLGLGETSA